MLKKSVVLLALLTLLLCFASLSAFAENNIVATVTVQGGEYREFTSIEKGWVYALEQSLEKPTTIKLCADWIAPDGVFYCTNDKGNEYGTDAGGLYLYDDFDITIDLNGHKIDRNLKEPKYNGFVFYMEDTNAKLTIKDSAGGGKITGGNISTFDGGAIYVYDGSLYIEGGKITGNHARNGGGIYWYSDDTLCITGGEISGNTATENGGGIYHGGGGQFGSVDQGSIYLGGDVKIYGNSGAGYENNNLYFKDDKRLIYRAAGQTADIPNVPFTAETVIGISAYDKDALISGENSRFNWGDDNCFFSDSDKYYINMVYDATGGDNKYKLYLDSAENKPSPTTSVMAVTVEDGVTMEFTDFGKAWAYALRQSLSKPITVTLLSDWVAENGSFYCTYNGSEYGSQNGYLYINDDHDITIDLNGHKIDRNLSEIAENGVVFQMYDYDAKLTIKDSVGGGKITGANNIGNGGAFLVERGSLYIDGGEITGNKAKQGAGIYANSQNCAFIYIDGGKITNNTADYGAGIYMYEGYLTISGGEISGNTAEYEGGGVYWESDNDMLISGGKISGNSAWRGGGIYMKTDMTINGGEISANSATWGGGIFEGSGKAYLTGGKIINNKASYGGGILWLGNTDMYLGNTITGNVATDFGGGVYIYNTYVNIFTGGSATVSGNSSGLGTDNILLSNSANNFCNGSKCNFDGATDLTTGAKIGVRCLDDVFFMSTLCADECGYNFEDIQYFSSDNPAYRMMAIPNPSDSDHPYEFIILSSKGNTPVMEVTVDDQTYTFCDFGDGWGFALTAAEYGTPTSIKLLKDWVAPDGKFEYNKGSYYGSLYIDDSDVDLTIDLNGYKIDRNLDTATSNGSVFYIESASKITIIDNSQAGSGMITGGNNTDDGGAFYVYEGNLYIEGAKITGNHAKNGAGIYWYSDSTLCIIGNEISGNTASENGGGIYHAGGGILGSSDQGKIYLGGDTKIYGNSGKGYENSNLYLEDDDKFIYRAAGQTSDIPNAPFKDGAVIGVSAYYPDSCISGENNGFSWTDYRVFFTDSNTCFIRPTYTEDGWDEIFTLNISTVEKNTKTEVVSVEVANTNLVHSVSLDREAQVITITGYLDKKSSFYRIALKDLIKRHVSVNFFDLDTPNYYNDFTVPHTFRIVSYDDGSYNIFKVVTEWICINHKDEDCDCKCDYCDVEVFNILNYNAETKEATVFAPKAGKYTLIFADYEGTRLASSDVVEYNFKQGVNTISQVKSLVLTAGDKIMLWQNMTNLTPVCKELTIE